LIGFSPVAAKAVQSPRRGDEASADGTQANIGGRPAISESKYGRAARTEFRGYATKSVKPSSISWHAATKFRVRGTDDRPCHEIPAAGSRRFAVLGPVFLVRLTIFARFRQPNAARPRIRWAPTLRGGGFYPPSSSRDRRLHPAL